jgi:hypothetical protein
VGVDGHGAAGCWQVMQKINMVEDKRILRKAIVKEAKSSH